VEPGKIPVKRKTMPVTETNKIDNFFMAFIASPSSLK
jgi:hypothetical protein